MKYTSIWFDLDNTILDFSRSAYEAFHELMKEIVGQSSDKLYQTYQPINKKVWKELEQGKINQTELRSRRWSLFFDAVNIDFDAALANKKFLDYLVKTDYIIEGSIDLLNDLKGKSQLILVTNGLKEVQRKRLEHYRLMDYFEHIVISDEIGVAKPHSAFFEHTMKLAGSHEKKNVLMIGDTLGSDIQGSIAFGVDSCWLSNSIDIHTELKPTYTIQNLVQLRTILEID